MPVRLRLLLLAAFVFELSTIGFAATETAVAAQPAPAAPDTLVVGLSWPGQSFVGSDQAHTIQVYEAELAIAVARTQGLKVSFKLGALSELLADLAAGRVDFIPGLARTPVRQNLYDFSVPHSRMNTHVFVRRSDHRIASAADLAGRTIILVENSYAEEWAQKQGYTAQLVRVPEIVEGVRRLSRGDSDCMIAKPINMFAAMRSAGVRDLVIAGPPITGLRQDLCLAVRQGNRDLLASLNEALFTLKQTGELDRIYEKWAGLIEADRTPAGRIARGVLWAAAALLILVAGAWAVGRVQLIRARVRMAEIETHVAARTEELAAAKAHFEAVIENTPAGIVLVDPNDREVPARIIDCNELTCRLHGYTKAELTGTSFQRLLVEPVPPSQLAAVIEELRRGGRRSGQTPHRRKDGSVFDTEFHTTLVALHGREFILNITLDITDRLRAEDAMRRTEQLQRLVLQATNDGIFDWDVAADRFALSARGGEMLGLTATELPSRRSAWWTRLHPEDAPAADAILKRHLEENAPFALTARFYHQDGAVRWLYCRAHTLRDSAGNAVRMVGSATDITDLKRIDEELQLSRRLRAVGELVGGIAHEFNNLLTPILLETSTLLESPDTPPAIAEQLRPVVEAARRSQDLTSRLLQFGRNRGPDREPRQLSEIVESTLELLRSTIDRRIEIHVEIEPRLPPLPCDAATMGQVVMNLLLNARDALLEKLNRGQPPGWRPRIDIRLGRHTGPNRATKTQATNETTPREWQRLSIRDNGSGIDPKVRDRIFEPFFTTKEVGQGSGLGLAMVWAAASEMHGWVEVESNTNAGTIFHLCLPSGPSPAASIPSPPPNTVLDSSRKLRRRILLVEDDALVGNSISRILKRNGHDVTWLTGSDEAATRLLAETGNWDALVTDLNMPGLGGEELVVRVRRGGFTGRIVVVSGNISRDTETRLRAEGVHAFVLKPFEIESLARALERD